MSDADPVMRLEGKLTNVARQATSALITFYVRGDRADIEKLAREQGADCLVGVLLTRDMGTANGQTET